MINLLLNIENTSVEGLNKQLLTLDSSYLAPTKKELDKWPYKCNLAISPHYLIGKVLWNEKKIISDYRFSKFKGRSVLQLLIREYTNNEKEPYWIPLTGTKITLESPIYKKKIPLDLHPSRGGKFFWEHGFQMKRYDYKKLYYKTKDYRDKYQKGLNESFGTTGAKAPMQIPSIRKQITTTMQEKYGVNWFLKRGEHYSAVTETMIERHGVENLFYSDEWQSKMKQNQSIGFSKLEKEVISYIAEELGHSDAIYVSENKFDQATVMVPGTNRAYFLDYLHPKKKIIIEVFGDYWHCNPKRFEADYFHPNKKKLASEIWKADENRNAQVEKSTKCTLHVVWEWDWIKNNASTRLRIKQILDGNSKD